MFSQDKHAEQLWL